MDRMWKLTVLLLLFLSFLLPEVRAETLPPNFKVTNEMIYQKLIEIEKRQVVFEERFKQIDRRFEQIDRRFEQVDKRFEELRKDMNIRFKELREDINARFDDLEHFLNIITAIFTTLTVFVIGFAYWDRRTIISKAKEETIKELENSGKLRDLILVLREKAKTDSELERILKEHKLL